jgi:hypothetical protein
MKTHHPLRALRRSLLVALLCLTSQSSRAEIIATAVNPTNNHTYHLLSASTWPAAEAEAVSLGGHLATINDAAEQAWIYNTFTSTGAVNRALWIGLRDGNPLVNSSDRETRRSEFTWVSGEDANFTNWAPEEPNNPNSSEPGVTESYVHIWNPSDVFSGRWNNLGVQDTVFNIPIHGVVEIVPPTPEISVSRRGGPVIQSGGSDKTFGSISVGSTGRARSYLIRNPGTAPLTVLGVGSTGRNARDFRVSGPPVKTLAPGRESLFQVRFKPLGQGARSAILQIRSNVADENRFSIRLSGRGR